MRFCKEMFKYVYKPSVSLVRYHQNTHNYVNAIGRRQLILLVFLVTVIHLKKNGGRETGAGLISIKVSHNNWKVANLFSEEFKINLQ